MRRPTFTDVQTLSAMFVMAWLVVGCGDATTVAPPVPAPVVGDRVLPAPVTEEYPGRPWRLLDGVVAAAVITLAPGPAHCGWEESLFLTVGWPLGEVPFDATDARLYLRDPLGLHAAVSLAAYAGDVALPADAFDTGYRYGPDALWVSPATADREVFMVRGVIVERWPRAIELLGCA
jgi:hypothetical protein